MKRYEVIQVGFELYTIYDNKTRKYMIPYTSNYRMAKKQCRRLNWRFIPKWMR